MVLAGRKSWTGWAFGLLIQPVWLTYGFVSHQFGFVVSAALFFSVYLYNLIKWRASDGHDTVDANDR